MLKWLHTDAVQTDVSWAIEVPAPGVVIIDVAVGNKTVPAPLHWRAGSWTKPPLDVALDEVGHLVAIQFVVQDERLEQGTRNRTVEPEVGVPRFDVRSWPTDRYRDESVPVDAFRAPAGELMLRIGDERPLHKACEPSPGLVLAFAEDDHLARVEIGPLTSDDWATIDTYSV